MEGPWIQIQSQMKMNIKDTENFHSNFETSTDCDNNIFMVY